MLRFTILLALSSFLLHLAMQPATISTPSTFGEAAIEKDTVPFRVDEALIQELTSDLNEKTWRDSGYYFRLEVVNWVAKRLGTTQNGNVIILASFSSGDPSSLNFQGQAVFRFDPKDFPSDITPSRGMRGEALIAFPEDVLFCPSTSEEVGLGQSDPYFPLYLSGVLTSVDAATGGNAVSFETVISVQLRDMEIIM